MKRILSILMVMCTLVCSAQTQWCTSYENEVILEKKHLIISWNKTLLTPNYVAYKLTKDMTVNSSGVSRETENFYEETVIPMGYRVKPSQYTNTGYDRGHMSPAADWSYSQGAMHDSFSMANIAPQKPNLNRRHWKKVEDIERYIANLVDTAYVITGTIFNNKISYISDNIAIPSAFYKTIVGVYKGEVVVCESYIYKNINSEQKPEKCLTTIDHIEKIIGKDLYNGFWFNDKYESRVKPRKSNIYGNTYCKAVTKKGTKCTRKAVINGYCSQHNK